MFPFKVCCIKSIAEARLAMQYGAVAIGLVSEMPSGPGPISIAKINSIATSMSGLIYTWILTSKTSTIDIMAEYEQVRTNGIQFVDEVEPGTFQKLRDTYPDIFLVQVKHVEYNVSPEKLAHVDSYADAILLDSGSPGNKVKILGGTGKAHDWQISRKIVTHAQLPVYLAGGLNPMNAANAIQTVNPKALDVCSGLRTNGLLDETKLNQWAEILANY